MICTQNYDGFIHNYSLYRNEETGLYEIIPWDYDATWGRDVHGGIMEPNYVPIEGYNTLTARLLDVKDIRDQYRLLLEEILETSFTATALEPKITGLYTHLRPHLSLDPYMKNSTHRFDKEPEFILRFIADRNSYLRRHLKDLYPVGEPMINSFLGRIFPKFLYDKGVNTVRPVVVQEFHL